MAKIVMLFVLILALVAIQPITTAVDCDKCRSMYESLKVMGYSEDECREGTLMYDRNCADCFSWGGSDSSSSSSSGGGGVCIIAPLLSFLLCGVFIAYYRKKREMKK